MNNRLVPMSGIVRDKTYACTFYGCKKRLKGLVPRACPDHPHLLMQEVIERPLVVSESRKSHRGKNQRVKIVGGHLDFEYN